jgi:type IV pilus biogenesis protein CpaD/CtpE
MMTADRATHLKIVVVALLASVTVMIVGIAARPQIDTSATAQVVKPSKPMLATGSDVRTIR